jgi:hypothetical protein
MWNKGIWRKGKRRITGSWCWVWHQQRFFVQLDKPDRTTGRTQKIEISGDNPNFNGWTLEEEKAVTA